MKINTLVSSACCRMDFERSALPFISAVSSVRALSSALTVFLLSSLHYLVPLSLVIPACGLAEWPSEITNVPQFLLLSPLSVLIPTSFLSPLHLHSQRALMNAGCLIKTHISTFSEFKLGRWENWHIPGYFRPPSSTRCVSPDLVLLLAEDDPISSDVITQT